ncbi:sensor domain-containing diguanylate cyclase [Ferribacterium limneticum]|uniref:sensor domain-containing diguanylate cyclase n=1 Tax=Ferribacterium limneticum TaxID=76259 RepID=UPI001CF9F4E6|nr:sensor domain-containing diguanylate cyclase [Ferribacterium limneticum]UCV19057.1 sensor domain-containing diguanylate cyclase [Ferribacterium limneticum]
MSRPRFRPTLLILLAAWLGTIAIVTHTLLSAEINRWEAKFDVDARLLVSDIKHKLDTNEAVLAGFSAFLQAVDRSDTDATMRYAASAASAYPHIYMIEVARKLDLDDEAAFQASLRKIWRADFSIKDFAEITGRTFQEDPRKRVTWPILFMYPALPEARAIYGVRLETVDYLSRTVALAQRNIKPVVSPVFSLYEGGGAYILLQEVNRPAGKVPSELNFFGDTMMALLLVKTQALIPARSREPDYANISISASIVSPGNPETLLFEQNAPEAGGLEHLILPNFARQLGIDNSSQPTQIRFARQLLWGDFLQPEKLMILLLLGGALLVVPWVTIRHYLSLDRAEVEQERSAYLATHDLLTSLPNRFLFTDRFEHALRNWQRNGHSFALMLADLDYFKEINDRHGHDVGDQVLVACASRMAGELRSCDTVARHGGDEFVILLANVQSPEDAENVGKKVLAAVSEPIETTAGVVRLSCSIGIAICPTHGTNLDVLRKAADIAMYEGKDHGRSTVSVFSGKVT